MAHRPTPTHDNKYQKLTNRSEHANIRGIFSKIQRRLSDQTHNNKSPKQSRSIHRHSRTAPNTPQQEPRSPKTAGSYSPTKEIDKAITIFKSDAFRCVYNANKSVKESVLANRPFPSRYEFQYNGELVVLDGPSLYPALDREMSNSPLLESRINLHQKNGQRNGGSNLSSESSDIPMRYQDNGLQSKRLSITFGASQEAVGLSIKRLEQSEGALSGIYIKGIQPNSPASRDGRLKVFDELLEVNGRHVRQYTYDQLKDIFLQRGIPLKLTIHRNSSAAILHDIGYQIPNDNTLEDKPPQHTSSGSDLSIEYIELSSELRDFGFFVGPGCGEYPVVNHIAPGSVTQDDGRLRIGDELIRANEHIVLNVPSQRVMEIIQNYSQLMLKVRHQMDPLRTPTESNPVIEPISPPPSPPPSTPPDIISVSLIRGTRGSLGITIKGVVSEELNGVSPGDGIYVAKVSPDGPAALTGLVKEGDRIVKVGETSLKGLNPKQALYLVKMSGSPVTLHLERGGVEMSLGSMYDLDSNPSETRSHVKDGSFNRTSVSDTSEQPTEVFTREESVKSTSIHSGVSSIHGFYPSHLSEACLQFEHDPDGAKYRGTLPREEKSRLIDEWQPRVGSEKIVKIAQLSKYTAEGEIGLEIKAQPVMSQKHELCGMRTVISAIGEGPAKDNGILHEGDEILEINGVRVTDVHHDDVVKLLKATPQEVRLVIARPHTLGNLPSHYLMNDSPSSTDGDSPPSNSPELGRKRLVKKHESLDRNSTFPRHPARGEAGHLVQTDLDEASLAQMLEMKEKEKQAQDEVLEQMQSEKDALEKELFSRLTSEDKTQVRHNLDQVRLKYEKEATLPRPSKYSRKYPAFKHSLGISATSYVASGIATTPRAPKITYRKNRNSQPPESLPTLDSPTTPIQPVPSPTTKSQLPNPTSPRELGLTHDESNILNLVCVPFQRETGTNHHAPIALIPFPTTTSSATTSDDESIHSPTKVSYPPDFPRLSPISQESEQVPQEITVTKEDTLGIGIERRKDTNTPGGGYKVIINDIVAGSASAKDGRLKIGDELLSIKSYSVRGRTKAEIALHITNLPRGPVILTVLHQQQNTLTKKDTDKISSAKAKARHSLEDADPLPPSINRRFAPISHHERNFFPRKPMDKAYSLSTLSDGSKLDHLGSRITHSSSNSNNSLNDPSEPYPLNFSLFPSIPSSGPPRTGVTNKVLDDFNMEQAAFESEGGHRHRLSKSLDLEREETSSASLDDIPTRLLGDFTFQINEDTGGVKKPQGGRKQDSNSTPVPEVVHPKHSLLNSHPPASQQVRNPPVKENKQPVGVPRGVVREVRLSRKSNANLGISIVEKPLPGSGGQLEGIFIKSISDPIILSGCLEQDDQILEVNGIDMKGFVHDQAVNLIKKASEPVIIKVIHSTEPVKRVSLDRIALDNAELGGDIVHAYFTSGKKGSGIVVEIAKPIKERMDKSYFKISEVLKRSRAEECRNVIKDDVIINVNGINAVGMPHHQLVKLLNSPHAEVSLILSRPKSNVLSPHNTSNDSNAQRTRRYLKTCLIDKLHEVEITVESQQNSVHRPVVIISGVKSKHPSFREEIHPGDELVAINKQNLAGYKVESVQRWLYELRNDSQQYEISFYSHASQSSTSTGSGHSYEQEVTRPPAYGRLSASQFTVVFYKEAKQDVGLVLVDGEVEGVFIEEVDPSGLAASDLRVRPGCKVIAVNDRKLIHDEANFVELVLNGVVGSFSLTLEGPYLHKIPANTHGYFRYSSESSQELPVSHSPQAPKNIPPPMQNMPELDTKLGIRIVQLVREVDKGFGLTIRGGANTSHGDLPLFVGKVFPQQAAYRSGQVQERDVILAINDHSTLGMTRGEAVSMLKALNTVSFTLSDEKDPIDDIVLPEHQNNLLFNDLTSSRESMQSREAFAQNTPQPNSNPAVERKYGYHPYPQVPPPPPHPMHYAFIPTSYPANMYPDWNPSTPPYMPTPHPTEPPSYDMVSHNLIDPGLILVNLRCPQRGFGFSISGGVDNSSGPQPILIKSMIEDGAAKLDGNLSIGDEICAVNGYTLKNATHRQAVNILKQCQETLKPDQEVQLCIRKRHK